VASIVK